jgi:GT2 family glycosyltransferase
MDNTEIQKDISIIIVNWNTKALLLGCLHSLMLSVGNVSNEIIVVDNASSDGSVETVRQQYPYVTIIQNNQNLGFAKANNIGIRQSKGRYICLINSDVIVKSHSLEQMHSYMDQNPTVGILGPKLLWPDLTLQLSCRSFPSLWNNLTSATGLTKLFPKSKLFCAEHMAFFEHDSIRKVDALTGAFLMVRAEAISRVGLLDEDFFMYGEETDWCKRFWKADYEVAFFPEAEVIHYGAGSSSKDPIRFYKETFKSKLRYWNKHHNRYSQIGFLCITLLRLTARIIQGMMLYLIKPKEREQITIRLKGYIETITLLLCSK